MALRLNISFEAALGIILQSASRLKDKPEALERNPQKSLAGALGFYDRVAENSLGQSSRFRDIIFCFFKSPERF